MTQSRWRRRSGRQENNLPNPAIGDWHTIATGPVDTIWINTQGLDGLTMKTEATARGRALCGEEALGHLSVITGTAVKFRNCKKPSRLLLLWRRLAYSFKKATSRLVYLTRGLASPLWSAALHTHAHIRAHAFVVRIIRNDFDINTF